MSLTDALFYAFAALAFLSGVLMLVSRNPVNSAMFLVVTMAGIAALFVLLHAFFLAAIQILVYAGAVMVLFLFVIMLLDLKAEQRRRINLYGTITALISVGSIAVIFAISLGRTKLEGNPSPTLTGDTTSLGTLLFTQYLLPFEVISVLLLVAMVGVVLLSKKNLK